jgi:hypothetical protein
MPKPDFTKLGYFDRTIDNGIVAAIPSGSLPKFIKVRLPGSDGPVIDVWWTGNPALAVDQTVSIRYSAGNQAQYSISGGGSGAGKVSSLDAPDGNPAPAWSVDNSGNLTNPGSGTLDGTAVSAATETARGTLEIATQTETNTGTDDARAVTPLKLKTRIQTLDAAKVSKLISPDGSIDPAWNVDNSGVLLNSGGGQLDLQGTPEGLILDGDGDTAIDSFTDDTINFTVNGTIAAVITASGLDFPNGGTLNAGEVDGLHPCEGRLTLTSGTAVTTTDVTAATTIYFTPFGGNNLGLYNGSKWLNLTFTEKSISLSGFTASKPSDVFAYISSGAVAIERLEWTNDTTRATALTFQDGVLVKSGATDRRYIGTFRTTATTGQCEDSDLHRYVWNRYNQVEKTLFVSNASGHTYDSTTVRAFNGGGSAVSSVLFIVGVVIHAFNVGVNASLTRVAGDSTQFIGVGLNTNTAHTTQAAWATTGTINGHLVDRSFIPALGLNELWITESGGNTGTDPTYNNAGLKAMVKC